MSLLRQLDFGLELIALAIEPESTPRDDRTRILIHESDEIAVVRDDVVELGGEEWEFVKALATFPNPYAPHKAVEFGEGKNPAAALHRMKKKGSPLFKYIHTVPYTGGGFMFRRSAFPIQIIRREEFERDFLVIQL